MSTSIRLLTSEGGDWNVVLINGEVDYQGHSIPSQYWIDLLTYYGFNAMSQSISNYKMGREIYD